LIELIRARDYREQSGKNGGGLTREIAVAFSEDKPQRVLWRVAIEDGELKVTTFEDQFVHDVEIVTSAQRFVLDDDEIAFVYAMDGTAEVESTQCAAGDTLWLQEAEAIDVRTGGSAAVIRITPI
jgi:hypothetical protein